MGFTIHVGFHATNRWVQVFNRFLIRHPIEETKAADAGLDLVRRQYLFGNLVVETRRGVCGRGRDHYQGTIASKVTARVLTRLILVSPVYRSVDIDLARDGSKDEGEREYPLHAM